MFTVAVVGPDGAGKTSVARALERALPFPATYLYMGTSAESSDRVLPTTRLLRWLRRGRRPGERERTFGVTPAPERAGRRGGRALRSALRLANRVAEECYRQLLAGWHRRRGRVVIFDRHFLADFYTTDVRPRTRPPLGRRLHGLFLRRLYPPPDLVIYLDAPAELLRARKQEASVETLEAMRANYRQLADAGLRYASVDASRPLADVVAEVSDLICRFARERETALAPRRV